MKVCIIYASTHHGNTKKLIDAIASKYDVKLIDATKESSIDLSVYDIIGFASGVAFGSYYPQILKFAKNNLPNDKKVFFIHTAGSPRENHNFKIKSIAENHNCIVLGTYFCKGYDTYGPFKLVGGIAKNHPDENDINKAVEFFENIVKY